MRHVAVAAACVVFLATQHTSALFGAEWATRVAEVTDRSHADIEAAVTANDHAKARELIRSRDSQLFGILGEFETAPAEKLSEGDAVALIHSYEMLWQWEKALKLAEAFLADHPAAEAVHMAHLRCLVNLGHVDAASRSLSEIEDRFAPNSPIRLFHSMLASKYQVRKNWERGLHHSDLAARHRIALIRSNPEIADWAILDFRRIAELAIAMDAEDTGRAILNDLANTLDCTLADLGSERPSDATFSQECLARKLRADIAYWLGEKEVGVAFQQWVRCVIGAWESGSASESVVRRKAAAILRYLERHGGILTPRMLDSVEELKSFIDTRRADSPKDRGLARLSTRCERAVDSEVFRTRRDAVPFGGIGP